MDQNINNITHAYVTCEGTLAYFDTAGATLYLNNSAGRRETNPDIVRAEFKNLEEHGFIPLKNEGVLFQPQHIREVLVVDNNALELRDQNNATVYQIPKPYNSQETLNALYKTQQFMEKPGFYSAVNNSHIRAICFNESVNCLEFIMKGTNNILRSHKLSQQAAPPYLRNYQAQGLPAVLKAEENEAGKAQDLLPIPKEIVRAIESKLKERVIGQDPAAEALGLAFIRNSAGLKKKNKTIGSFLFVGPTGVGKTEIAERLAEALGYPLLPLKMSEFAEQHSIGKLIGAPVGYVNSDEGGQLTNHVKKHPQSVILLDEAEKAHPKIYDIFLNIFDKGCANDGLGHTIDFRNTIIIMTSNLTSAEKPRPIGFAEETEKPGSHNEGDKNLRKDSEITGFFRREMINRFDAIIPFRHLEPNDMEKIVMICLNELKELLNHKNTSFHILPEAVTYLARKGYDPADGARPLQRLIQSELENPLADQLLDGALENGGSVTVLLDKDKNKLKLVYNNSASNDVAVNDNAAVGRENSRPCFVAPALKAVS